MLSSIVLSILINQSINLPIKNKIEIGVGILRKKNFTVIVATTFSFPSLRTSQAKGYSLDKEQTNYDDLLDALRLSLKGYNIK
jgi:hypothetical protein